MNTGNIVFWVSLSMSVVSFISAIILLFRPKSTAAPTGAGKVELQSGLSDAAKLAEALAKLADSFAKAGPAVMAMVSALAFLMIATLAAGFLK